VDKSPGPQARRQALELIDHFLAHDGGIII
jgi:hypothetical protein